jgi:pSer/pThr/pTyr-binding forkhead associated (FHA) protein
MPTLTIQLPGLPPVEHILREEAITVGRMKGNTIALDDSSVSLSHAKITRMGAEYHLKDLNSTNGTMLNGQSISEARLCDGDLLKFGEVLALFRSAAGPASALTFPTGAGALPLSSSARSVAALPVTAIPIATAAASARPSSTAPAAAPRRSVPGMVAAPTAPPEIVEVLTASAPAPAPRPAKRRRNPFHVFVLILGIVMAIATAGVVGWIIYTQNFAQQAPSPATESAPAAAAASGPAHKSAPPSANRPARATSTVSKPGANKGASPSPGVESRTPAHASEADLAELLRGLQSPDVQARRHAAQSINAFEGSVKSALPMLRTAVTDSDPDVQTWSALALINNQEYDKAAIPILVRALNHENPSLRQVACISLALIPYDEPERATVVPALQRVASSDDSTEVRKDAQTALKIIQPDSSTAR